MEGASRQRDAPFSILRYFRFSFSCSFGFFSAFVLVVY